MNKKIILLSLGLVLFFSFLLSLGEISELFILNKEDKYKGIDITYHILASNIQQFQEVRLKSNELILGLQSELNIAFHNRFKFNIDTTNIQIHIEPITIIEIYNNLKYNNGAIYLKLVQTYSKKNTINIYIIPSITDGEKINDRVLLGFTPILEKFDYKYDVYTPIYDNIFVSHDLNNKKEIYITIIHEIGHYLGQKHVFDLTYDEQLKSGINSKHLVKYNYMNYGDSINNFTDIQVNDMEEFLYDNRFYLINK